MGEPKGLFLHAGRPWILTQLETLRDIGLVHVVVILGYQSDLYLTAIPSLPDICQVAINEVPQYGPFSSLQCGIRQSLLTNPAGIFVLPVDSPCPDKEVWSQLAEAPDSETQACLPTWNGDGGHPVLLSPNFAKFLADFPLEHVDARLDVQMFRLPPKFLKRVSSGDRKICFNLNTPEDFKRHAPC